MSTPQPSPVSRPAQTAPTTCATWLPRAAIIGTMQILSPPATSHTPTREPAVGPPGWR